MRKTRLLLCLVAIVAVAASMVSALTSPSVMGAESISVISSEATSSFPSGIRFSLQAESSENIESAQLFFTAADIETRHMLQPDFTPAPTVDLEVETDFRVNFIPTGVDVTFRWRIEDEAGSVLETEPALVEWVDSRFDWTSVSSDQVTVYSYTGNEAFAKLILENAQATIDRLQTSYDVPRSVPLRIWVYDSQKDLLGAQYSNGQDLIAGASFVEYHITQIAVPEGGKGEMRRVVPHEVSHLVVHQAVRNPFNTIPLWLDEGLAVSAQDTGNEDMPAMVEAAAEEGRLLPLDSLNREFPLASSGWYLSYAESYSVVQFILERWGEQGISDLLRAYTLGISHDEAFMSALGVDVAGLDQLWKESLDYPGDNAAGVAIQTSGDGSPWDAALTQSVALLLTITVFVALTVSFVKSRRRRDEIEDVSPGALIEDGEWLR